MSTIFEKTINTKNHKNYRFNIEQFNSAMELAQVSKTREITDSYFNDKTRAGEVSKIWDGVESYEQAMEFLANGHQETVDRMKEKIKVNVAGQTKRFRFQNNIQGFTPIVPLALQGAPNCMVDMRMTQIKAKVVDVYYDMTCSCATDSEDIIKAGNQILSAIMEMEAQGYRFNLYAVQSYTGSEDADMVVIKVKSSTQPIDLKRISFPLCHTGFFRVVGFDWYSRFPKGTYRSGYGHALKFEFSGNELEECAKEVFGKNSIYFSAQKVISESDGYVKGVLTNESNNR